MPRAPAWLAAAALVASLWTAAAASEPHSVKFSNGSWPAIDAFTDANGVAVKLRSASPFGLSDMTHPVPDNEVTEAQAVLFMPMTLTPGKAIPAVILLHGAAGVLYQRELTYARQFAALGVAALVIDVFAARRDRASGFVQRLLEVTETMMIADAYAGLRYLSALPAVDPKRIAVMGFSYGGMVSVLAGYEQVARLAAPGGERFAAHVAFYGPCIARFEDSRSTGAPVLMVWGSEDAIVDPARCEEIAEDLRRGGAEVKTIVYEGAYHQWDGAWEGPFKIGRNLADCRFRVSRGGIARDQRTFLPMTDPWLRRVILGLCVDDEGYMIGRDDKIRAMSNRDVGRFLGEVFNRPTGRAERDPTVKKDQDG